MRYLFSALLMWATAVSLAPAATNDNGGSDNGFLARKLTNTFTITPGPDDPTIARVVSLLLERQHYSRQAFNDQVSSKFLDRYLDSPAVDGLHLYFLESDLKEFERYRTILDDLIRRDGNTQPGRIIFERFVQRVRQQFNYATNLLHTEKFVFDTNDRFLLNRKTAPRPKDLDDAKRLWRDRLRYEYLLEKLSIRPPAEIGAIVREKLEQKKTNELAAALHEKISKEKIDDLMKYVEKELPNSSIDELVRRLEAKLEKENGEEIVKTLLRRYHRLVRAIHEYDDDDVMQLYLTALANVYDPHSDYMGHSELENFSIGMRLSLGGIGALLRSEDGYCKIQSLTANGPAEKSKKLKPNDKIIAVAQSNQPPVDVVDMKLSKVVDLIRGPKNTEVRLTVVPADAPDVRKVISLTRDEIKLEDQAAKAKLYEVPVDGKTVRLGVIDLPSFYSAFEMEGGPKAGDAEQKSTTTDVARLIKKLVAEKVSGIVLDLRRNGGGALDEAIRLTGLFIKDGPVVQVKGPEGKPIVEYDPDSSVAYDGPLVVLTSRFSASASEILAGALQDYDRAVIVGDSSTHGKGTVQSLLYLRQLMRGHIDLASTNDPGALKITIRKFYRASGSSTQLKGVVPDVILPSLYNHAEVGESSLDSPMPWDTIDPAPYTKLNMVTPQLPELKRRSESRVAKDSDFAYLREEIERYKKAVAEKSVSLNETERRKEKQEADQRLKARKKELAARPEPPGKVYEITLKAASEPGLPPPVMRTNSVKTASSGNGTNRTPHVAIGKADGQTNAAPVVASSSTAPLTAGGLLGLDDEESEAGDDKTPNVDITLEETKRILLDHIELLRGRTSLAGAPKRE